MIGRLGHRRRRRAPRRRRARPSPPRAAAACRSVSAAASWAARRSCSRRCAGAPAASRSIRSARGGQGEGRIGQIGARLAPRRRPVSRRRRRSISLGDERSRRCAAPARATSAARSGQGTSRSSMPRAGGQEGDRGSRIAGSARLARTNRSRTSCRTVPRSGASGDWTSGSSGVQAQHMLGIDRVGVADQALDLGDRQLSRAAPRPAGAATGAGGRIGPRAPLPAPRAQPSQLSPRARMSASACAPPWSGNPPQQVGQPVQPARGTVSASSDAQRAGQPDLGRGDGLLEIMRRQPDPPFGQQQPRLVRASAGSARDRARAPRARCPRSARRGSAGRRPEPAPRACPRS